MPQHTFLHARRRSLARVAVALIAIVCGLSLGSAPVATAGSPSSLDPAPMRFGLAYGNELLWKTDADLAGSLDTAVSVGANWIRVDLPWADIQPLNSTQADWWRFDRVVAAANARHLKIIAVLAYTPGWARPAGCSSQSCAPADVREYGRFVRKAVARYAKQGVHTWEVWNEPNSAIFWMPRPDAHAYAVLLKVAAHIIRIEDPDGTILFGGLAAERTTRPDMISHLDFLAAVTATGATADVDVISFHPYTFPALASENGLWWTSWQTIHGYGAAQNRSIEGVLAARGLSKPIWITEYGAPTGGPGTVSDGDLSAVRASTDHTTEELQARLASDAVRTSFADPSIQAFVWYSERDRGWSTGDRENHFGLLRPDGTPKPSYAALRDAAETAGVHRSRV